MGRYSRHGYTHTHTPGLSDSYRCIADVLQNVEVALLRRGHLRLDSFFIVRRLPLRCGPPIAITHDRLSTLFMDHVDTIHGHIRVEDGRSDGVH